MRYPTHEEAMEALGRARRPYPGLSGDTHFYIGEWGRVELSYAQYLFCRELREAMHDKDRYRLEVGRRIYLYKKATIARDRKLHESLRYLEEEKRKNPLQFFCPNGIGGREFLNDRTSSLKIITAGNRYGKTTVGLIDMLLDMGPCDPEWLIFKENGVKHRTWDGRPVNWGCASYMWRHIMSTVAPLVLNWAPHDWVGAYKTKARGKTVTDKKPWIEMSNGSLVNFYVYEQPQENFESAAHNGWVWDEQGTEAKFDGADERTRTCHGRHVFPLTPHKVEGRMDTGAGTWIHALWKGEVTKGHRIGRYTAHTFDNPDWIYPEKDKVKALNKWVTLPTLHHDKKTLEEGKSRLGGAWHESSGLVYDDLVRDIHVIEPFELKDHWTRYRAVDHGHRNPTAAVMACVTPNNDVIVYDEYYEAGKVVYDNALGIIQKSGNSRFLAERRSDFGGNTEYDVYEEEGPVHFEWTKLDGRSFSFGDPATGRKYGDLYRDAGLDVTPAKGGDHTVRVPLVSEFLRVDYSRDHLVSGMKGAPKCYIFSTCTELVSEIFSYRWAEQKETALGKQDAKPMKGRDHAVNAFEYLLMSGPTYRGEYTKPDMDEFYEGMRVPEPEAGDRVGRNRITGY